MKIDKQVTKLKVHLDLLNNISAIENVDFEFKDWLTVVKEDLFKITQKEYYNSFNKIVTEYYIELSIFRYSDDYVDTQYMQLVKQFLTDLIYKLQLHKSFTSYKKNRSSFINKILNSF